MCHTPPVMRVKVVSGPDMSLELRQWDAGVHSIRRSCAGHFAEGPGFRVGNSAANLQREVSHTTATALELPPPKWPCVTFTLLVVVSTSQPGVFVLTPHRALIRPSGEDAMGRSCILDSPPPRQGDARSSADVCLS